MRFFSTASLKYFVQRTKVGRNLPVYTEYRNGGDNCFTIIKGISGETRTLSNDLAEYLASFKSTSVAKRTGKSIETSEEINQLNKIIKKWRIREELGHIWVKGKQPEIVKKFLESKGF